MLEYKKQRQGKVRITETSDLLCIRGVADGEKKDSGGAEGSVLLYGRGCPEVRVHEKL